MTDGTTTLNRSEFVSRYGGIYEHSPWVAERSFDGNTLPDFLNEPGRDTAGELRSPEEARRLGAALAATLLEATDEEKLALVLAHPDLVGRAALAGKLTNDSSTEQSSAGLDKCTPDELERFQASNKAYRARFGFPFIMAVRAANREEILEAFERRLLNEKQTEFETALVQIDRIARLRLEALVVG